MRIVFFAVQILAMAVLGATPLVAQTGIGKFEGDVVARFLPDGRNMRLEKPVSYVDPNGQRWDVPAGTETDGASIPRVLWMSHPPFTGKYRPAAVIHDYYCRTKSRDWRSTHRTFYFAMLAAGVEDRTAKLMYAAVHHFGPRWGAGETRSLGPGQELPADEQARTINQLKSWIDAENPALEDIDRQLDSPQMRRGTAERRVALVIGNSDYRNTPKLQNPKNDATDVAAALGKVGFQVISGFDLDKQATERKIRDFIDAMPGAAVGLFFYAGHGLQVDGQNYLVPIDAQLTNRSGLNFELVRVDLVQRAMEAEAGTNILFFDACRDNPLARNLARALGTRSASIGRGLASIEAGQGTLISFSTQPGNVALDGEGLNSPFTGALLKQLGARGDDLSTMLIKVRNDVLKVTQNRQVPWEHSSLTDRFFFIQPDLAERSPQVMAELAFWEAIKDSRDAGVISTYLDRFPDGMYSALARVLVDRFQREAEQKAALAARERELAAAKAVKQAAEAKEADAARKAREAKQAEELRRARELLKAAEDEARAAREAAKAADQQRLAAVKAAEDAARASETARRELTDSPAPAKQRAPGAVSSRPAGGRDGVGGVSFKYWPSGGLPTGQTRSTVTAEGWKLTCVGGNVRDGSLRRCEWR
jgi:uncharacterized caspase-like protein